MCPSPLRYSRHKPRYRLANSTRFVAAVLVLLLAAIAVFVVVGNGKENPSGQTAVVVTPTVLPSAEPSPSFPPVDIPDGKSLEPVLIVIDAGHGGRDPGTTSPYNDLVEKDVTLDIARKVEALLAEKGIKVMMTREGDDHLNDVIKEDLLARAAIANDNRASLFVSIHVNAYDLKIKGAAKVNGMEVYYMNKKTTYENFNEERFAQIIGEQIKEATGIKFNGIKSNNLSVLRNTLMPAVLVETAYITNKEDNARLNSEDFRKKTAQGIADGIALALEEIKAFEYDGELYVFKEVGE